MVDLVSELLGVTGLLCCGERKGDTAEACSEGEGNEDEDKENENRLAED